MTFLPKTANASAEAYVYNEFVWTENGHPYGRIREANETVLAFFEGTKVTSVEQAIDETTLSYVRKLATMSDVAKRSLLTREFSIAEKVARGEIYRKKNLALRLSNDKLFVWDTERIPFEKNKKIVGYISHNVILSRPCRPDEILNFYVTAYGDEVEGSLAFCRQYGLSAYVAGNIQKSPKKMRTLVLDLLKDDIRSAERCVPYTAGSRRVCLHKIRRSLQKRGVTQKTLLKALLRPRADEGDNVPTHGKTTARMGMTFLPETVHESKKGILYNEFVWTKDGRPNASIREANEATLRFFGGMNIASVGEIIGITTLDYVQKLATTPDATKRALLTKLFSLNRGIARGDPQRENDLAILLPNNKIFVWNTERTPLERNKKVVGYIARNIFSNGPRRPDKILELYVKAYGNERLGAIAFCRQYGLAPYLEASIRQNPRKLRTLILDLLKHDIREAEDRLPYTERSRRSCLYAIRNSLRFHGVRKKKLLEILMEAHKREVWKDPIGHPKTAIGKPNPRVVYRKRSINLRTGLAERGSEE